VPFSLLGTKKSYFYLLDLANKLVEEQLGCCVWLKTAAQHELNALEHCRDAISNYLTL